MKTDGNHMSPRRPSGLRQHRGCFPATVFGGARLWVLLVLLAACPLFASDAPLLKLQDASQSATNGLTESAATSMVTASNASAMDVSGGMNLLDDKYKLSIGDRVSFRILEDEDDPKALVVTDSGDLEVPYVGRFPAVGQTCKELASGLKTELEKEYYYRATVIVAVDTMTKMTKSSGKVYLVGAVHLVGPQEIPSDEVFTLSKAVLRAGGFTDFADQRHVKVTRKEGATQSENKIFTVNVAEILEKGKTDRDLTLEPGDLIFVPDRVIRF